MIRTRLFLTLSLLIVLFGIISAFIGVRLIRDRVVKEAQTRVELDLGGAWSVYNSRLREIETILRLIASDQLLSGSAVSEQTRNRLEVIRLRFGLDFLSIISPEGRVIARAAPPNLGRHVYLSHMALLKALEGELLPCVQ